MNRQTGREDMARLSNYEAAEILSRCHVDKGGDFHRLRTEQVEDLLAFADMHGYRKPRNANGSRGRYWCAHLQRLAARDN